MSSSVDISALRIKYKEPKDIFHESSIEVKEPFHLFRKWFDEACSTPEIIEPNAMCLATATRCSSRQLDLYCSEGRHRLKVHVLHQPMRVERKELAENPNVALAFYWLPLRRSVRIEGTAERIPGAESAAYFHQRPRASQIGALASPQSRPIPSRDFLDQKERAIKEELGPDGEVPLPNWGGYLVRPAAVEFWQGQTNRLHDRIRFRKPAGPEEAVDGEVLHQGENGWIYERLAP
ncbi:hypothetical protein pipiens_008066 [Culex pipiens pipiens]|uniref:Pyridoxine-5'-phosphate oxidase n=1 Tax=Culex pipiens pipiens TaxID=38569 RepID=A0ABD1DIR8_CULPP